MSNNNQIETNICYILIIDCIEILRLQKITIRRKRKLHFNDEYNVYYTSFRTALLRLVNLLFELATSFVTLLFLTRIK